MERPTASPSGLATRLKTAMMRLARTASILGRSTPCYGNARVNIAMIAPVTRLALGLVMFVGTVRAQDSPTVAKPRLIKGDRICLVGNALAERMQHHGWLEAYVQAHLPEHEPSFRNLGFGADTLTVRQRTAGFGSPDDYLNRCKADVIFAFFGYNESFAGADGLDKFKQQLRDFISHTLSQKYNGKSRRDS